MFKDFLLSAQDQHSHKFLNQVHTAVLISALTLLMIICAWSLSGWRGVFAACLTAGLIYLFAPRLPGKLVLKMYRAQPISTQNGHELYKILQILAERADLPATPELYVIPSATLNAFATGTQKKSYIALTEGLLRKLDLPELASVLAHEVSHIRNNDLEILNVADIVSRITQFMSYMGLGLLLINLPLLLLGEDIFPWSGLILLYLAPSLSSLLQLALSRAREYDADLEAAVLTGDPKTVAATLQKLDNHHGAFWEDLMYPGRRISQPSLLRSHPPTEKRIRRLLELSSKTEGLAFSKNPMITVIGFGAGHLQPRYHWPWPGIWY